MKGDLKPCDSLEIPALKPLKAAIPIAAYPKPNGWGSFEFSYPPVTEQIPKQPVGSRMILFLEERQKIPETQSVTESRVIRWNSSLAEMEFSTVWIDGSTAYCFLPVVAECRQFVSESSDASVLVSRIHQVLVTQRQLTETLRLPNAELRAERLGYIAMGGIEEARKAALYALADAGSAAVPEILQLMDQRQAFDSGPDLVLLLAKAAGKNSGPQLHARLGQDLMYWKAVAPTLAQDSLGQWDTPGDALYMKFGETDLLVRELNREQYAPAGRTIAALRSFWMSQRLLYDAKWGQPRKPLTPFTGLDDIHLKLFRLVRDCDLALANMPAKRAIQ